MTDRMPEQPATPSTDSAGVAPPAAAGASSMHHPGAETPADAAAASTVSEPIVTPAGGASDAAAESAEPVAAPHRDVLADDLAPAGADAGLPGAHRGGFQREMTAPVPIAQPTPVEEPGLDTVDLRWAPAPAPLPRSAPWALTFSILGLMVSVLVGWGFLIGIVGAILAIVALRRPWEARGVAIWALSLSLLSLVYSAGWLWWASTQGPLFN